MQVEPSYGTERRSMPEPGLGQGQRFAEAFMESYRTARRAGRTLLYSGARPWLLTDAFCSAFTEALIVTPEGDLVNCFEVYGRRHAQWDKLRIGRLTKEEVFVDERRRREFQREQDLRRQGCEDCFCYWHCAGDCWTRRLEVSDSPGGRCAVNRAITRELLAWNIAEGVCVWKGIPGGDAGCRPVV